MSKTKLLRRIFSLLTILSIVLFSTGLVAAQPYGAGKFGANVPYGGQTSLAISTGGNVSIQVTPTDSGTLGTANNAVTVTSTDVVGFKLYIRSVSSTDMTNGSYTLAASSNVSAAPLASNTWGYNTDASTDFIGTTLTDVLIKDGVGPYSSGDTTTVTYGVKVDNARAAGSYVTTVVYTAVPQTQ